MGLGTRSAPSVETVRPGTDDQPVGVEGRCLLLALNRISTRDKGGGLSGLIVFNSGG